MPEFTRTNYERRRPRVLAIASAGGHWEQLMLLRSAFDGCDVQFASTMRGLEEFGTEQVRLVPDCNRNEKVRSMHTCLKIVLLLLKIRPAVVVTTGALPGLIALFFAKRLGAKTIWIDSVANAEEMSLAGKKAQAYADIWLSQWPDVARAEGAAYAGSVL
jgi:UDP-N-acetylglucosamine:LPS N-acetylglucosamine transferase